MDTHADTVRLYLSRGPLPGRQLTEKLGVSQPTLSRVLNAMGADIVRIGAARSIHYALRDTRRGLPDIPIHRVDPEGRVQQLGTLVPVCPDGFVMQQPDGTTLHSEGLPWWLLDMRPQGYLGRAYAARHGADLGLPPRLGDWTDTHALRALLARGHDLIGNLLPGDAARAHFLATPLPDPIPHPHKPEAYAQLAREAARGELPGSSAGGEQPKFTARAMTAAGPRHVIVKFSEAEAGPVPQRWRDLLLAEHLALETLRHAGIPAAASRIIDHQGQRFLEVERFDRIGDLGRCALTSLSALDAEFLGTGNGPWPVLTHKLAAARRITPGAAHAAARLWAFGTLIGNTDMHSGNLSFITDQDRPYALAPAYDMTPMAFAPRSGGSLPDTLPPADIHASVSNTIWRDAEELARDFVARVRATEGFSARFATCVDALVAHGETAGERIGRLG